MLGKMEAEEREQQPKLKMVGGPRDWRASEQAPGDGGAGAWRAAATVQGVRQAEAT